MPALFILKDQRCLRFCPLDTSTEKCAAAIGTAESSQNVDSSVILIYFLFKKCLGCMHTCASHSVKTGENITNKNTYYLSSKSFQSTRQDC